MDEARKAAYRYLVYWAFLEIRSVQWVVWGPGVWLNPVRLVKEIRNARRLGALANWMHNLALFSSMDFTRFDEERFWKDGECFLRYDAGLVDRYRKMFERRLAEATTEGEGTR